MNPSIDQVAQKPKSVANLFWAMTSLALQGFGGIFPISRKVIVEERRWLTNQEFVEEWAVAQVLPGPNIVNLAVMLGARYFGLRGALASIAGIFLFPSIVLILMAIFFEQMQDIPEVAGALQGMGAVAAGLIAGSAIKLALGLKDHPITFLGSMVFMGIAFLSLAIFKISLILVLFGLGFISVWLTYRRISALRKGPPLS